ncbi:MAG TPA: cyclohexa-1,5-dienecarbonyl-CoA hydratase [Burkholderiales bacterium]|nr:cyclohexa-1,5-dienecarbonyl-CoA hydratase [Burkholderiales bacterium]
MTSSAKSGAGPAPATVWTEHEGRLLRLRLARPKANVIDAAMIAALDEAIAKGAESRELVAAIIDHEGPHFSFGASVEEHLPASCAAMLSSLHALLSRMLFWPRPILVAARGQCLGGGLELALAGTLLFAGRDAVFGQPEMKLGVFAPAASVLLPGRIGQARAEDLLHSGRSIDAPTAQAWGLAQEVGEDPEAMALDYVRKNLLDKSAASLGYGVQAVRSEYAAAANKRLLTVERLYLDKLMKTHDAVEGLNAFLGKRQPKWEHR